MRAGKVLIQCNYCLLKVTIVSNWCQLQRMSVGNLTGQVLSTQFIKEGIEISIVGEPMAEADGKHATCSTGLQHHHIGSVGLGYHLLDILLGGSQIGFPYITQHAGCHLPHQRVHRSKSLMSRIDRGQFLHHVHAVLCLPEIGLQVVWISLLRHHLPKGFHLLGKSLSCQFLS